MIFCNIEFAIIEINSTFAVKIMQFNRIKKWILSSAPIKTL